MTVTVSTIMDLMIDDGYELSFFINNKLYTFLQDEIPYELLDMEIDSIDNPAFQTEGSPLCLNISEEGFDDIEAFEKEFKDYIVE